MQHHLNFACLNVVAEQFFEDESASNLRGTQALGRQKSRRSIAAAAQALLTQVTHFGVIFLIFGASIDR
ncbi:MAG: hypothetical protein WD060_07605, partial [Pirellulales bacterium]